MTHKRGGDPEARAAPLASKISGRIANWPPNWQLTDGTAADEVARVPTTTTRHEPSAANFMETASLQGSVRVLAHQLVAVSQDLRHPSRHRTRMERRAGLQTVSMRSRRCSFAGGRVH